MAQTKQKSDAVRTGLTFETAFYANPKRESPFRFRAAHINDRRAPKVIDHDSFPR